MEFVPDARRMCGSWFDVFPEWKSCITGGESQAGVWRALKVWEVIVIALVVCGGYVNLSIGRFFIVFVLISLS